MDLNLLSHPIVAVIFLLGMLIFVHEAGHFLVGRLCGIAVQTFSIGFGPAIFVWTKGLTEYRLSVIPLGGFVKFYGSIAGETVPPEAEQKEFFRAKVWKRALVVSAGPFANFLLAVFIYTFLISRGIEHPPPVVGSVLPNTPAQEAKLEPSDRLLFINGQAISTWSDMEQIVSRSPGKTLNIKVLSGDGKEKDLQVTPMSSEATDILGKKRTVGRMGIIRGQVPNFITVLKADSWAGSVGLKSLDQVESVASPGFSVQGLKTFDQVVRAFRNLREKSQDAQASIRRGATTISLSIKATSWHLIPEAPLLNQLSIDETASTLGFADGQLTIGAPGEKPEDPQGLHPGDRLLQVNDTPITNSYMFFEYLQKLKSPEVKITVERDFANITLPFRLKGVDLQRPEGVVTIYTFPLSLAGQTVEPEPFIQKETNIFSALAFGVRETFVQTTFLLRTLMQLFMGELPLKSLGGPIMIAKAAADSARAGLTAFFTLMALISINLGVVNLVPIPVLDGGQLVLLGGEAILRRPPSLKLLENFQKVGFAVIVCLIVLAMYNDMSRFWKAMITSVTGSFQ